MKVRTVFAALLAAVVLAGCGGAPTPEPTQPEPTAPANNSDELRRAKQDAKIADCPTWFWPASVAAGTSGWPGCAASR